MGAISKFDHRLYGLAAGLIGPVFGALIFYAFMFNHITIPEFARMIMNTGGTQAPLISVSLTFNLIFFFLALQKNWYRSAQGVIMAMFIYAPIIIYLKYG